MGDRQELQIESAERAEGVVVREIFQTDGEFPPKFQEPGWQSIVDTCRRHVEARTGGVNRGTTACGSGSSAISTRSAAGGYI